MNRSPESDETRERKRLAALRRWANEDRKAHGAKIAEAHAPKCQQRRADRQTRLETEKQAKAAAKAQKQVEQQAAREAAKQAAEAEKQRATEAKQAEKQQRKQLQSSPLLYLPQSEGLVTLAARQALLHTPAGMAFMLSRKQWLPVPHLRLLSLKFMEMLADQCAPKLLVSTPPRHGKSFFCSHYFPIYFLNKFPRKRIILASYAADFAAVWGRLVRNTIQDNQHLLRIGIAEDSAAADRWDVVVEGRRTGGGMTTCGVGGSLTGRGADLLLLDDITKNWEEAQSELVREKQWEWFRSTALTRLEPSALAVVIMTRWHADDLAGRLLQEMADGGEKWEVIRLPAIAEDQPTRDDVQRRMGLPAGLPDPLGREPGQALWPERYSEETLLKIKRATGNYVWSSLYMQSPTVFGGDFFKRSWFKIVERVPEGLVSVGT